MPAQDLFGTSRTVPADGATNWGEDVRVILTDMMKALDKMSMLVSDIPFLVLQVTQNIPTNGSTQAVVSARHDLAPSSPITLGAPSTSAIADGTKDGQTLLLVGTHDTNTVTIDSDHQNVVLDGDVILGKNDAIFLVWDSDNDKDSGAWVEVSRSG